jgi:hypothetical protein
MSVVLTPHCFEYPPLSTDPHCTMCNSRLFPPFIVWRGEASLYICGDCGQSYAQGLMADLIHLKAIKDLKRLYPAFTLERHDQVHLTRRQWHDNKLEEING